MLVDYERVVLELETLIASKKSHGRNDLLVSLAELKADYRIPEGLPEQSLRQYGNELSFHIHHGGDLASDRPAEAAPVSERPDGPDIEAANGAASQRPKEDTDERSTSAGAAHRGAAQGARRSQPAAA